MYFAVAKTIATNIVSSRLDYCNSLYHNIAFKYILKLQRVHNCLAMVITIVSLTQRHFLNHCIGSLSDIVLVVRSVQLLSKQFHPSNQHIYIHCSLLQDSPDSFDHTTIINFLFPVLRQLLELELFPVAAPTLWNSLPVSVKFVGNVATFRRKLKTHLFKLAYHP